MRYVLFAWVLNLYWRQRRGLAIECTHRCVRSSNFKSKRTDSGASPKIFRRGVVGVQGEALAMAQTPFRLAWKRRAFSRADKLDEKAVVLGSSVRKTSGRLSRDCVVENQGVFVIN